MKSLARKLPLVQFGNGVPDYPPAGHRPGPPEVNFARMHARKRPLTFVDMAKALLDLSLDMPGDFRIAKGCELRVLLSGWAFWGTKPVSSCGRVCAESAYRLGCGGGAGGAQGPRPSGDRGPRWFGAYRC